MKQPVYSPQSQPTFMQSMGLGGYENKYLIDPSFSLADNYVAGKYEKMKPDAFKHALLTGDGL